VWDENVNRRHLNETQRGLAAAEMETFRHGGNRKFQEPRADLEEQELRADLEVKPTTRNELGRRYGVGHGTMYGMSIVRDRGVPELKQVARAGKVSVRTAKAIAELPSETQSAIVRQTENARDRARALQTETAKYIQRARIAEIGKANRVLDPDGETYDMIYADPPWHFPGGGEGGDRDAENHYPTMSEAEICALPVAKMAAKNCVLAMWTTSHHLLTGEAFRVIEAWCFEPHVSMVWVKDRAGLGRFVRHRHEHLLIALKGNVPAPPTDCIPESVIEAPRRRHSEKPPLHAMIERMFPGLDRRIELFARSPVPGWEVWGNQSGEGGNSEHSSTRTPMRPPIESEIIVPSSYGDEPQTPMDTQHGGASMPDDGSLNESELGAREL
jgi:N6-adenosine-specific RNA methylase IME4